MEFHAGGLLKKLETTFCLPKAWTEKVILTFSIMPGIHLSFISWSFFLNS
jgi:hypothetical protein